MDLSELPRVPLRGEGSCGGGGANRDSAGSGAMEEGLTSRGGRKPRLPLRFGLRPHIFAFLIAQSVKNLPAMQETRVQSLGGENPLEKEMAIHSGILGLPWWLSR